MMNDVTLAGWNRVKKVCLLVARNPGSGTFPTAGHKDQLLDTFRVLLPTSRRT